MQSELKSCAHCGGAAECDSRQAFRAMSSGKIRNRFAIYCTSCNADMGFCYDDIESCNHDAAVDQTITAWNARASDAEITRLTEALRAAEEREKALREALESKPWPPTDADLREMLALIVGAWWSESSANRLRTARMLNAEDIKGMYAVRDALAPYIARASDAEITRLTEALRAAEEREKALRDALGATESAIAEYYRYWTGGEMRGSYDGKPERNGLWQALHKARQALAGAKP